ncbi:MAG TPA: MG2 domain-containing protein [Burkholderiales bacterium]|nr:MG2 domain-containing protein [Burkholderiales bacterium]
MKTNWSAILLLLVAGTVSAAQVEVFSPQGEVKGVRQVAARFSEPMVAFGDPRLPEPFDIECPEPGTARWADQKNWVYDFGRDLPAGVRCSFRLKADLLSLAGNRLEGGQTFELSTGGPAIVETLPYEGVPVDEEQIFILGLDAAATDESIAASAYCDIKGITERVDVRVLTGDDRRVVLEARKDFVHRFAQSLMRGTRMDRMLKSGEVGALPIAVVQCKRRLPNNAEIRLVWGKGIVSASGVATSQDQAIVYRVRDTFQAKFTCNRVNKDAQCLPIMPMRLSFTAPVARTAAERITLKTAAGKAYPAELPDVRNTAELVEEVGFAGPFPERAQFMVEIPSDVTDDAGRKLANQKRFPLQVRTDEYPPLAKFAARFGIIELKGDGIMPVTLRNLEALVETRMIKTGKQDDPAAEASDRADQAINWLKKKLDESKLDEAGTVPGSYSRVADGDVMAMLEWMKRLRQMEHDRWAYDEKKQERVLEYQVGQSSIFTERDRIRRMHVPKPQGARAFEVVGIPLKKPGFYVVELASPRLGAALLKARNKPYYVQSAALVTNLAVHFKWGREISLVWVTTLDTGVPVPKAQVAIQDCSGKVYYRGQTDAQGRARIAAVMPERERLPACLTGYDRQLVASVRMGDDLSFVMSEWNEGISRWRFNLRGGSLAGPYIATTVFDRTLLRAGETVSMKHFYRRHGAKGFAFVPVDGLPKKAVIQHQGSDEKYEIPLTWDARNTAETVWRIPEGAKKGNYSVLMTDMLDAPPGSRGNTRTSGSFRVEEFRVPLMKAEISGPKTPQVKPESVNLGLSLRYLSGGGTGYAPVKVRAVVRPKMVSFRDYDGFTFANGKVVAGIEQQRGYQWFADEHELEDADAESPAPALRESGARPLKSIALDLDAAGSARVSLPGLPAADRPQELNAEMEYSDPNGEVLTTSARVALWPSKVILGIKPDSWALSQEQLKFQVIALDLAGKSVKNQQVKVQLYVRNMFTHRKRLVGGFYGYESGAEVKELDVACAGKTDERGRLFCAVKPPVSGNIIMAAEAKDRDGNIAYANGSAWVAGKDAWWFDQSNDDRIDVIPERKRYEPGETAQLQVRMPFQRANALITIEREGVLESFVQPLAGAAPVVKVPIKGNYAPNVFVSVLVVRGRIADLQPTALVDLGKPAFKMGVAEVSVGWRAHELGVKVSASKPAYKVRGKARVTVQVTQRAGGKPVPVKSGEVAIAAVDEGLLELLPNDSWKLLDAMMRPRGIEVDTSTASMQVVGKRHYGRKALPQGGGGGRQTARELFDTLLLWKARVPLDDKGRAAVDIPLKDSLTSFRIIAVADSGNGLFGTGETSIRATQDLMLLSGLPPLVREGDRFDSRFTVRNASERVMDVEVNGNVEGQALPASRMTLAAGEARDVSWEATVPVNANVLRWEVTASELSASGKVVEDRLKVSQKAIAAIPVRTFQATLSQLEQQLDLAVKIPENALPERGGVSVALAPKLAGPLPGVREYMAAYSYTCLEQRISRAVALRDQALWQRTMDELPSFLDRDGFAKYFALERTGSDTLTAYILAIAHESGWSVPDSARGRMQNALTAFVTGRAGRDSPMPTADLTIRKVAALEALSRYQVLEPNWLDSIAAEPNLWPTSAVLDWYGVMKRGEALKDRDKRLAEAGQIVRSRLNFQGTTMGFSTERTDYLWWLMISGDVNANRALLAFLDADQWREDMPRLTRGALGRQHRGRWNTTVANAWGVLAMEKFSAKFESAPVTGQTQARLNEQQGTLDWGRQAQGGVLEFKWPPAEAALSVSQSGTGKPWVTVQSRAAIPLKSALSSGFRVVKIVTPVETKVPGETHRGDVVRVRLELEAQSDMAWVVVDDPVPAGSAILGSGLAKDSQILSSGEQRRGFVWPAFEERTFDAFRAYYRFVPKGAWVVEYTLGLNNGGRFELPPTRVEAMYAPEMFGELPNSAVTVNP